ncbi:MAG TPA: helix-turn-helix transcriptional regulator [Thermoanaerobaculia bacterium]|jgi:transcriptional regulator with XRE-family HTH domain|nr:helix-turn-helix transcriptional regulator [Thermoanaerobaculia bacterium]
MSGQGHNAEKNSDLYTEEDIVRFGFRIAELRQSRGWTQREASRRTGIHATRLSRIEHGSVWLGLRELIALKQTYGGGLEELVFGPAARLDTEPEEESLIRQIREVAPPEDREALLRFLRAALAGYRIARSKPE